MDLTVLYLFVSDGTALEPMIRTQRLAEGYFYRFLIALFVVDVKI